MPRFPRTRRVIRGAAKWTGASLFCVLGAVAVVSLYRYSTFIAHSPANAYYGVTASGGALTFDYVPPIRVVMEMGKNIPLKFSGSETWNVRWSTQPNPMYLTWKPDWRWRTHPRYPGITPLTFVLPLWIPLALLVLPTAWLFWSGYRRTRPGHCPVCRYDRAGLPTSSPCPECGHLMP